MASAPARGPHGARLPLPLRAHRRARGLLLQRGPADGVLGGVHARLVPPAPGQRPPLPLRPQQPAGGGDHDRGGRPPGHAGRPGPRGRRRFPGKDRRHPGPSLPAGDHPRGGAGRGAADVLRRRGAAPVALDGGDRPRGLQRLLRGDRGAGAPRGARSVARRGGAGPGRRTVRDLPAGDAAARGAGHRGERPARLHPVDRRLRRDLLRRRSGRHDPAAPHLFDAQGRRHARGQRGLDAAPGGHDRPDRRSPTGCFLLEREIQDEKDFSDRSCHRGALLRRRRQGDGRTGEERPESSTSTSGRTTCRRT